MLVNRVRIVRSKFDSSTLLVELKWFVKQSSEFGLL